VIMWENNCSYNLALFSCVIMLFVSVVVFIIYGTTYVDSRLVTTLDTSLTYTEFPVC
jgi:hypothetical protein